ncbi:hypothetical protein AXYL_04033 [Achromobacter xylosoxidans A8]|uniref:Uncharacterized protein n=1 Tax=Achromobacter xylosoxidans (strain A8) TaxID=762376 RepID=E3HSN6_ACHXA|nr:hypothetical protein [Achromobacter xylosoxidans]ADP17353.1 hypothetical protein AXYL_04033 [Achromobacter xylosoxidans A8]
MSLAEETQNKKRRNLMVTTLAVIIAAFLGLRFPIISAVLPTTTDPADVAWKFWTVPAVLILYQVWRWSTDSATKEEYGRVGQVQMSNYEAVAKRHLVIAVRRSLCRQRTSYDIRITSELPDGDDWSWRKATLKAAPYIAGRPLPISDTGQAFIEFTVRSQDTLRHATSSFGVVYQAGRGAAFLFHAQAAALTLWQSPDCQDVAVPWLLAPIALGICVFKVAALT